MAKKPKKIDFDLPANVPNDFLPFYQWFGLWFHDKQVQFVKALGDYWEVAYIGGNGSGKTRALYWSITAIALGLHPTFQVDPPVRMKVLVTDFEHGLDKVAYETLFVGEHMPDGSEIGALFPKSMVESMWRKEDKSLRSKNGSIVSFMTSEQPRHLHSGTTFDILACDEEAKEPPYDESKRGLRKGKGGGRIMHALTPPIMEGKGPSWTKHKVLDPFESGELTDTMVIQAAMADNPAITPEFIERFSRGKTEEQLQVQLYGKYPTWGVMAHPDFQDYLWDAKVGKGNLLPHDWEIPFWDERAEFEMAIDYHDSKPAGVLWACITGEGDVVIYDEITPAMGAGKTISELARIIMDVEGHQFNMKSPMRIKRVGDPKMKDKSHAQIRGFNAWQEFRNCGIRLSEGWNRMPGVGISVVNDYITGDRKNHPRLFILQHLETSRRYMRNHFWIEEGKLDGKWSDYPWCIRQIVQTRARKAKEGMKRNPKMWPKTSYGGDPRFGPYTGLSVGR